MKITKGTIIRTIMLFIVIINEVLKKFGVEIITASEGTVASLVETVISVLAIVSAWWYNNSFSDRAKKADQFFKQLKEEDDNV